MSDAFDFGEWLTTRQAVALAKEYQKEYTQDYLSVVANSGDIPGCFKAPIGARGTWMIPKQAFIEWVKQERRPGPKTED